jgi:hypothetical protein
MATFAEQAAAAIDRARGSALDDVVRAVWQAHGQGLLDDEEAGALAERAHTRRIVTTATQGAVTASQPPGRHHPSIFPPRRPQRPRKRADAIARRRRVAASGAMPPALAARFTTGETAALAIVADEVRRKGQCELPLDAIAARAGVSRSTTKNAIRTAREHGLVHVIERPRPGQKHLSNLTRIVDREWRAWLKRRDRAASDRGQKDRPHGYYVDKRDSVCQRRDSRFVPCQDEGDRKPCVSEHADGHQRRRRQPPDTP